MVETKQPPVPPNNVALKVVRVVLGLDQGEAAELIGISPGALGQLELGKAKKALERQKLERYVASLKPAPGAVESALTAVDSIRPDAEVEALGADLPPEVRADLEKAAATHHRQMRRELFEGARELKFDKARAEAVTVWEILRPLQRHPADRRQVIEESPRFATWALVEKLAHESDRATIRDVEEALALADLDVWTAERLHPPADYQAASREYAQVYLGNARRVKGWLDQADAAFFRAKEVAAVGEIVPSPFSRARMLDREASLRRDQRRFDEALALQDQAFKIAQPSELGSLWLNRSVLLHASNDPVGAIESLQNACATFDEKSDPRDRLVAQFNLAASLIDLGRGDEVEALLPQVRAVAESQRATVDLLRVNWLEGKCAAVVGKIEDAAGKLELVWRDFADLEIDYDAALAALDLAVVYLSAGQLAETKALALRTAVVFRRLKIEQKELAAVRLFWEAAGRERATVELARRAHRALVAFGASLGKGAIPFVGGLRG
ncbi:MAG: helix-turn-helix transcriptional regulator [Acidobacteriota bacterium]